MSLARAYIRFQSEVLPRYARHNVRRHCLSFGINRHRGELQPFPGSLNARGQVTDADCKAFQENWVVAAFRRGPQIGVNDRNVKAHREIRLLVPDAGGIAKQGRKLRAAEARYRRC